MNICAVRVHKLIRSSLGASFAENVGASVPRARLARLPIPARVLPNGARDAVGVAGARELARFARRPLREPHWFVLHALRLAQFPHRALPLLEPRLLRGGELDVALLERPLVGPQAAVGGRDEVHNLRREVVERDGERRHVVLHLAVLGRRVAAEHLVCPELVHSHAVLLRPLRVVSALDGGEVVSGERKDAGAGGGEHLSRDKAARLCARRLGEAQSRVVAGVFISDDRFAVHVDPVVWKVNDVVEAHSRLVEAVVLVAHVNMEEAVAAHLDSATAKLALELHLSRARVLVPARTRPFHEPGAHRGVVRNLLRESATPLVRADPFVRLAEQRVERLARALGHGGVPGERPHCDVEEAAQRVVLVRGCGEQLVVF
mmetsp:Transcript_16420/g.53636  ORF Transcript_16420/g.53636 Transcript_16420/m.53636 type:complete len:375 (+) Transcript_16420:77-1201(+)